MNISEIGVWRDLVLMKVFVHVLQKPFCFGKSES